MDVHGLPPALFAQRPVRARPSATLGILYANLTGSAGGSSAAIGDNAWVLGKLGTADKANNFIFRY
jgi:hypothetical protein